MELSKEHQAIIDELCAFYELKGFIRKQDVLDLMSDHDVSIKDTERLTGRLIDIGVLINDDNIPPKIQYIDRTQTDYIDIFHKVLRISNEQDFIINYINKIPIPKRNEWVTLIPQTKSGNTYAFNRLFDMYLRNVVKIALSTYYKSKYEIDDLIQEGAIGLMHAIQKYDFTKHGSFISYFPFWIMQFIDRSIATKKTLIRFPVHMIETMRNYKSVSKEIKKKKGIPPNTINIANELKITYKKAKQIENFFYSFESIEEHMIEHNDGFIEYELIEDRSSIIEEIDRHLLREQIQVVLNTLKPREAAILRLRIGFDDGREKTLDEIGIIYNVTRERIRQIELKALEKLRLPTIKKILLDFWF